MRTNSCLTLFAAAIATCTTFNAAAHADALRVNGVCELNDCTNVSLTATNTSSSTPFNFTYQFANADTYRIQGTVYAAQTTSSSGYYDEIGPSDFVVTYLGNSTNTASGLDIIASEFLGKYPVEGTGTGSYFSVLQGIFGPELGLASSASATFNVDGRVVSTIGPVSPPPGTFYVTDSGTDRISAGTQTLDYDYSLTFGAGSTAGSFIELYPTPSPVPEPTSFILLATGLAGLAVTLRRRRVRM